MQRFFQAVDDLALHGFRRGARVRDVDDQDGNVDVRVLVDAQLGQRQHHHALMLRDFHPHGRNPMLGREPVQAGLHARRETAAFEHAARQAGLAVLQLLDLFLDAAAGDQLVDEHRLVLADAVGAVAGLGLGGRVPPGVEVDHGIGGGEVEAGAAGLEADQEHRHLAGLERLHRRAAILGGAGELDVGDLARLQFVLDQAEHAGELGEQQHAAAFAGKFLEHFQQGAELAGVAGMAGRFILAEQAQVAAGLAQAQQRLEDDDLAAS
ncbi:hypothetical protein D3C86_1330940 [compost metagenome]